ncbi:hypothetical protein HPB49_001557 [Dermacentor silvarum]|uniref:Uncharacterized protein n=1 Tax=Dermacentor silvarum TaxID=543639 RepID=A0ACB8CJ44_DERSI|nr:hypothetical protein HPB49_001557 [Dermacentor silvarum]
MVSSVDAACGELFSVTAAAGGGKRRTGKADQGRPTDQRQRAGSVFRQRRCSCCFCVDLALTLGGGGDRWPLRLHMWTTVRMLFRVAGAGRRSFGAADERRRGPDDSHYRQPGNRHRADTAGAYSQRHALSFAGRFFFGTRDNSAVIPRGEGGFGWEKVKEGTPHLSKQQQQREQAEQGIGDEAKGPESAEAVSKQPDTTMQQSRRIVALALVALLVATLAVQEARAFHKLKHKKIAKLLILAKALHPKVIPIIPFHITKHTKVPVHYPAYYAVQSHSAYKHVILPESHGYEKESNGASSRKRAMLRTPEHARALLCSRPRSRAMRSRAVAPVNRSRTGVGLRATSAQKRTNWARGTEISQGREFGTPGPADRATRKAGGGQLRFLLLLSLSPMAD